MLVETCPSAEHILGGTIYLYTLLGFIIGFCLVLFWRIVKEQFEDWQHHKELGRRMTTEALIRNVIEQIENEKIENKRIKNIIKKQKNESK